MQALYDGENGRFDLAARESTGKLRVRHQVETRDQNRSELCTPGSNQHANLGLTSRNTPSGATVSFLFAVPLAASDTFYLIS